MIINNFKKSYLSLLFLTGEFISEFSYAAENTIDLTLKGASSTVEDAIFYVPTESLPGGTGVIDSFVRIKGTGSGTTESGYNTDAYQLPDNNVEDEFDTLVGQFTHSLLIFEVVTENFITIDGTNYFEFFLDINQTKANPLIELTSLKLFTTSNSELMSNLSESSDPSDPDYPFYDIATKIWDMDATNDTTIKLDYSLYAGSGNPDLVALFPVATLSQVQSGDYLVLYNEFTNFNAGFEEWARKDPGTFTNDYCIAYPDDPNCKGVVVVPIPEPTTLTLFVVGLAGMSYYRLRKQKKPDIV